MFSMIEIYKEKLKDLLRPKTPSDSLKIKDDKIGSVIIQNLHKECVSSKANLLKVLLTGEKRRTFNETPSNKRSSRSHVLAMFEIFQSLPNGSEKRGILNLVDLACSEKVKFAFYLIQNLIVLKNRCRRKRP